MDTTKKVRISASLDADQHKQFKVDCVQRDIDISEAIEDLVRRYLAGEMPPPAPPGSGDSDPLCSMVRACVEAGEPWSVTIRAVVMSLYDKMRRES